MGQRISYSRNESGKGLKQLLHDEFGDFRRWVLEMEAASRSEFNEAFVAAPLLVYCKGTSDLASDFDKLEPRLVNELLAVFVDNYPLWNGAGDQAFVPVGPWMYRKSYEDSDNLVLATKDETLVRLWDFLLKGRSIHGHPVFQTYAEDYTIGFLSFAEQQVLQERIGYHFGAGPYVHPQYSGIEYVLQALSEAKGAEIVTEIEWQ